ncbi:ABC transporter permease [Bacteroides sp.]|uniref:ABC transporter permease n=1 Tax=Bacteroides sp. TaxID=29523 RepID=UPI003AB375E3
MNRLVWKLLRQHISVGQLTGFFLANLFGMMIVLLSVQFYRDVLPVFTDGDSFMKKDYIIATKKISTLGSFAGKSNTFTKDEIEDLQQQSFTKSIGAFTPSLFKVSAGLGMQEAGIRLSTEMFFEAVPDEYVDVNLDRWHFDPDTPVIPIIIPRNYLNLYNFGFAQSRSLPKLSEGVMSLIQMDIMLRGNGRVEQYKGSIVGFSNRLNTILVPQSFMDWANRNFAPEKEAQPSRLIVEVKNPTDTAITDYFQQKNYETEGNNLDAGKTTYFLRLITGIVMGVGLFISILSFYILMLSIFLLLQKNTVKLENLLLIGYSPTRVALPYYVLTVGLNILVLLLAIGSVAWIRTYYTEVIQTLFPQLTTGSLLPCMLTGFILFLAVSLLNILAIRRKIISIWQGKVTSQS